MKTRARGLAPLLAIVGLSLFAACATAKIAQNGDSEPVASPPSSSDRDYNPAPLPDGPAVIEGYDADGVTTNLAPAAANGTNLNRTRLDRFIEHGPRYPLTLVQVQPSLDGGQFRGFQVVAITDEGTKVFGDALQTGDVVVKVNDRSLARPENYMAAWESLKECDTLSVELVRNGQTVTASWPVGPEAPKTQTPPVPVGG